LIVPCRHSYSFDFDRKIFRIVPIFPIAGHENAMKPTVFRRATATSSVFST